MRPLLFDEAENKELLSVSKTYLWGNEFLIHPIVKPGVESEEIYFPKTNNWYNFYSGKKHKGGTKAEINIVEEYIPTYVRAGAFIPMIKTIQNTDSYSLSKFDLHYYHDNEVIESIGQLYNDDGASPEAYEHENYELLAFESNYSRKKLTILISNKIGKAFDSENKEIAIKIHNIESNPKKIKLNNKKIDFVWNSETKTVTVSTLITGKKINKLTLKFSDK